MVDTITITAKDAHSGESQSDTFGIENLTEAVKEFEENLPYRRYELHTQDFEEDYSHEVLNELNDLEVEFV